MPLTPKGYCDLSTTMAGLVNPAKVAEMPLTPKGYCDFFFVRVFLLGAVVRGRNAPNAERLL